MELNEKKLRSLFCQYGHEPGVGTLMLIRKEVEMYVYQYPRLCYRKGPDWCGDFYLYITDRLESIAESFPPDLPVKVKTWLNAVLANQHSHFTRSRGRALRTECLDEDLAADPTLTQEIESDVKPVAEGLRLMPEAERLSLQFYYLPETVTETDLLEACRVFDMPVSSLLQVLSDMTALRRRDAGRVRSIAEKLAVLNVRIGEEKDKLHRMRQHPEIDQERVHALMLKVARLEGRRSRLVHELSPRDAGALDIIARLYASKARAHSRLTAAKRRLKFEILRSRRGTLAAG